MTRPSLHRTPGRTFVAAAAICCALSVAVCSEKAETNATAEPIGNTDAPAGLTGTTQPRQPAREPIPEDTPRIRMALTGNMAGKLEPCGCASAQLGGLPRRIFHLRQDQRYDVRIEGGNMAAGATELDSLKLFTAMQALYVMPDEHAHYEVQGVGPIDLTVPNGDFGKFAAAFGVPLVSADLVAEGAADGWTGTPFVEVDVEDKGIQARITGLTLEVPAGVDGFSLRDPQEAWSAVMEGAAERTLRILMVHGTSQRAFDLARLDPRPDLVIGINAEHTHPPVDPSYVDDVPVVFPGSEGRCVLEVTLARLESGPRIGYHIVELAGSATARGAMQDETTTQLLLQHRLDAAEQGMLEAMAGRVPTANGLSYTGNSSCKECHQTDYEIWERSFHHHAWDTLEDAKFGDKYPWDTTKYPDCVGCHTVGYGEVSGFVNPEQTPDLLDVGCEACHGPGSAHVADPEVKMGPVGSTRCVVCHDHDQSPDFVFGEQWPRIRHGDK